ncbi:MAG TPA: (d)CMP kinase, partial [Xanthobacteraceae bacterium]|nr:(d)CMP kinase [Xanthobacteraceae bacterium]
VIAAGKRPDDRAAAVAAAQAVDLAHLDAGWLSSKHLGEAASVVAAIPEVREALLDFQQAFARRSGGAVLDGRDTGTVIAPAAEAKIFVTAAVERRAERRHRELAAQGETITRDEVLADLKRRDARDAGRAIAPLKPAPDAVLLDTTELDIEAAFRAALAIVEAAQAGRGRG